MSKLIVHIGESITGGGAQSVLRSTMEILKNNESIYEHKLICRASPSNEELIDKTFPVKGDSSFFSNLFSYSNYRKLKRYLYKTKPAIIHIHHYANLSPSILFSIYRYKKHTQVRVVHSVHTFEYLCSHHAAFDYKKNVKCLDCSKKNFKVKIFMRICGPKGFFHSYGKGISSLIASLFLRLKVVDFWTTPSNFLRTKMLNQRHIDESRVFVLRNPILDSSIGKKNKKVNKDKAFRFVYFGRFSEEKNIDCIIKAFNEVVKENIKCKLMLIGKGNYKQKIKKMVVDLDLIDNIEFIEFLPKKDLEKELRKCDVSLLSSKCYETASMVVVESIQLGLVPIVSNHGGMKEMVECCNAGIKFSDGDYIDLSSKMIESYNNYEHYLDEVEKSKRENLRQFNESRYFKRLIDLYSKI
ncbi:glycosyltransferase family 4 protein [Tenacibaculum sp. IMCC1]|uniref:Glycosyltransferase family 4 protein n=1 Tax=Tenacibaculum sp. Pbs-1 TaxID=3238748 RepID=A0AB33L310_9FLAO